MSDAEFRVLFARFDPSAAPRPDSVERLLAEIDDVVGRAGPAGADGAGKEGYLFEHEDHRMLEFARPRARKRRLIGVLVAVASAIVVTVAAVVTRPSTPHQPKPTAPAHLPSPSAQLQLYWRDQRAIGRANLDGTDMVRQAIPFNGFSNGCGIAVDRTDVYWAAPPDAVATVARAKRVGTGVDNTFIVTSTVTGACDLAVDSTHIYWDNTLASPFPSGTIGRANLDGTGVQEAFISGLTGPTGIAVDGTHIYWVNGATPTIGRANLDGTGVNQDFITGLTSSSAPGPPSVHGIAVDGAHIYWGTSAGTIGRASLDGSGVNNSFISGPGIIGGQPVVCGHDSTHLYWVNLPAVGPSTTSSIGRARLDGTDVQADFIAGDQLSGCAIGP